MYRLRQIYQLIPVYEESLDAFKMILRQKGKIRILAPEHRVDKETLELAANDYQLKLARLQSEKLNLEKHLGFYIDRTCTVPRKALPKEVSLEENFNTSNTENYSRLRLARKKFETSQESAEVEQSKAFPDLKLGPFYEFDGLAGEDVHSFGLALSVDFPLFHRNSGNRARAKKEQSIAEFHLREVKKESALDLESFINQYNQLRTAIQAINNQKDLEEMHHRIEKLYNRGVISTVLVIESHRQMIEFTKTRFEFELDAVNALWRIYQIQGVIDEKSL
jgi:cobalt-zinc-cadmium efflux system outer membrane protein